MPMNPPASFERVNIGPVPPGEECAQVGSPDYEERARAECARYKRLIVQLFGPPPSGATLMTVGHSHDFGMYYEVVIRYPSGDLEAEAYAAEVDADGPAYWDDEHPRDWRRSLRERRIDRAEKP